MHLSKFLHTENGKIIMSMILGFGLATMFRMTCQGKNCVIFRAPGIDEIQDKVFKHDGSCYKYSHVTQECNSEIAVVENVANR